MVDRARRIVVVGSAVSLSGINGLDIDNELEFVHSVEELQEKLSSAISGLIEGPSGFVIDAFDVSKWVLPLWERIPENIATMGLDIYEDIVGQSPDGSAPERQKALELLALASRLSRSGWPCLIAINTSVTGGVAVTDDAIHKLAATRTFGFRVVYGEGRVTAIQNAVTIVNSMQCLSAKRFTVAETANVSPSLCPWIGTLLRQWEMEEYEHDDVISSVMRSVGHDESRREVFLRAATLVRLMATRSFEHHECNARILFTNSETLKELLANRVVFELFEFQRSPTTWFHRADPWLVESGIETALSERSILAVDQESGRVIGVYDIKDIETTRFETFCSITRRYKGSFIIAAMESGYVEVYHDNALLLWYDRYQWRSDPFRRLVRRFDRLELEKTLQQKILGAISTLMDDKESSIIVFPFATQQKDALEAQLQEMRGEIHFRRSDVVKSEARAVLRSRDLTEISSLGLASILRLDGAHVINGRMLTNAAERILTSSGAVLMSDKQHGSGRYAAQMLSNAIEGFVVKVSASGELWIFERRSNKGARAAKQKTESANDLAAP